jgi:hypothetical protein
LESTQSYLLLPLHETQKVSILSRRVIEDRWAVDLERQRVWGGEEVVEEPRVDGNIGMVREGCVMERMRRIAATPGLGRCECEPG